MTQPEPSPYKHFQLQVKEDVAILHLVELTLSDNRTIYELDEEIEDYVQKNKPKKLLVNFGPVSRCATDVINSLLRARNRIIKNGGKILLCGMNKNIRGEFIMLNLDGTVFTIYDSATEALEAFNAV